MLCAPLGPLGSLGCGIVGGAIGFGVGHYAGGAVYDQVRGR